MLKFLIENTIIPPEQYAFIPGIDVGTVACLKTAISKWLLNIDKGLYTVITSFDLASAFSTLSIPLVLKKMKIYGVDNNSLKWFESYLNYRIVTTKIGNATSERIKTINQMSEGSQISSTLFLLQIADINQYLKYSSSTSFADDQNQFCAHKDLETALHQAQIDANATVNFFKMNEFAVQSDKTAMLIIRPKLKQTDKTIKSINVDGNEIKEKRVLKC